MYPYEYVTLRQHEDNYWWYTGLRKLTSCLLQRYTKLTAGSKVLDIGCGTGGNLECLAQRFHGAELYGIDLHPSAISMTRMRGSKQVFLASANELPFTEENFDAAMSLDVFYTQEVDDRKALSETNRILKMGGVLIINLPAFEFLRGEHDLAVHTRHRYTAGELREKLLSAGFTVRRLSYWNSTLFPIVYAARKLRFRNQIPEVPRSDLKPLPKFMNEVLKGVLTLERRALLRWFDLPFGSSIFAVAQKTSCSLTWPGTSQKGL